MYIFLTMEKVIIILAKFGIDITVFTNYEQTIIFLLMNILSLISTAFILYIAYRIILKLWNFLF